MASELESKKRPTLYGLRLSQLSPRVLQDILKLYGETAEMRWERILESYPIDHMIGLIKEDISEGRVSEWRFGSSLTHHSKLFVETKEIQEGERVISFRFSENLSMPNSRQQSEKGEKMKEKFNEAIREYLQASGKGLKIVR